MQDIEKAKQQLKMEIKDKEKTLEKVKDRNHQKKKNDLLIKMGLYDKEYMPEDGKVEDYPEIEQSDAREENQSASERVSIGHRFRYKPWTVSDEEFERLKSLYDKKRALQRQIKHETNPEKTRKPPMNNTIASNIRIAAIVILILYVLVGMVLMAEREEGFGIILIGTGVVTTLLYYGFSEIIRLLQEQVNQNKD